jgi:hypothetical protein
MPNYRKGVESDELVDITKINFVNAPGKPLAAIYHASATLTPAAVAANTTAEQTFPLAGVAVGDVVWVTKPSAQAGLGVVNVRVSAAGTLAITFSNNTAAAITPTAGETYQVGGIR